MGRAMGMGTEQELALDQDTAIMAAVAIVATALMVRHFPIFCA